MSSLDTFYPSITLWIIRFFSVIRSVWYYRGDIKVLWRVFQNKSVLEAYKVVKINGSQAEENLNARRIKLVFSTDREALGFMDCKWNNDLCSEGTVELLRYAFCDSHIHTLFSPGRFIKNNDKENWTEKINCAGSAVQIIFRKIPENEIAQLCGNKYSEIQKISKALTAIESTFEFPSGYMGYSYSKRIIVMGKGVGVVFCSLEYQGGFKTEFMLRKYIVEDDSSDFWLPISNAGNFWLYEIFGHYNKPGHIMSE